MNNKQNPDNLFSLTDDLNQGQLHDLLQWLRIHKKWPHPKTIALWRKQNNLPD